MATNKQSWDVVKPFLSNINLYSDYHIWINDKNKFVFNEIKLVELFNTYLINAVGNTTGKALTSLWDSSNQKNDADNAKKIVSES